MSETLVQTWKLYLYDSDVVLVGDTKYGKCNFLHNVALRLENAQDSNVQVSKNVSISK